MTHSLRILSIADMWEGADSRAIVSALLGKGHSVIAIQESNYFPLWHSLPMRGLRRVLAPLANHQLNTHTLKFADYFRPHLFLVCKGWRVKPQTVLEMKRRGIITINWYPDTGYFVYANYIPKTLPHYDWVFTTKSFGMSDKKRVFDMENVSLLRQGYDPQMHAPWDLSAEEQQHYGSDVCFIGTWSHSKQAYLEYLVTHIPGIRLKIWGARWQKRGVLKKHIQGYELPGREYAKAIRAAKITLGLLMKDIRKGASSGDFVTCRTFSIPASGGFMLHERTHIVLQLYREDEEIACFATPEELTEKVRYYLSHEDQRRAIQRRGQERCRSSYSTEDRAEKIVEKYWELKEHKERTRT